MDGVILFIRGAEGVVSITEMCVHKPDPVLHQVENQIIRKVDDGHRLNEFLYLFIGELVLARHDDIVFNSLPKEPVPRSINLHCLTKPRPAHPTDVVLIQEPPDDSSIISLPFLNRNPLVLRDQVAISFAPIPFEMEIEVMLHLHLGTFKLNKVHEVKHARLRSVKQIKMLIWFWQIAAVRGQWHHSVVTVMKGFSLKVMYFV